MKADDEPPRHSRVHSIRRRRALRDPVLGELLAQTSRSFYLSLAALPAPTRELAGLAYLLARAADTIADASVAPTLVRAALLARYVPALADEDRGSFLADVRVARDAMRGSDAESRLLDALPAAFSAHDRQPAEERARTGALLATLTRGMRDDLARFGTPAGEVRALANRTELLEYAYRVAGCVGEYWTTLHADHLPRIARLDRPALVAAGVAYGQGLQLVNILRDVPTDLALGRCYLPADALARAGLRPSALLDPAHARAVHGLMAEHVALARSLLAQGVRYARAIPRAHLGLHLASRWPADLGRATLDLLETALTHGPPRAVKVPRRWVYGIVAGSALACFVASRPRVL